MYRDIGYVERGREEPGDISVWHDKRTDEG